jgi:hypothetical protein
VPTLKIEYFQWFEFLTAPETPGNNGLSTIIARQDFPTASTKESFR